MQTPSNGETFAYRQQVTADEDGEFTMTLPYSTTGYDEYGPENGYTNVSVRATGPYNITTPSRLVEINGSAGVEQYRATVDVPEGQVNGDQQGPVEVTLERQTSELTLGDVEGDDVAASAADSTADETATADSSTSTTDRGADDSAAVSLDAAAAAPLAAPETARVAVAR
jgi:dolichyl-diphosphooligosaccharide--protein glycosyltransferase